MPTPLHHLPLGQPATVIAVTVPGGRPEWLQQLDDLGFTPGERVVLMGRGWPGGDPLSVRVGVSTFALRQAEAACVMVAPSHG